MPNIIYKIMISQLFPQGCLPTIIPVIIGPLLGLVWIAVKKDSSYINTFIYNFLITKPKWFVFALRFIHPLVLAVYWRLIVIYPEIRFGVLGNFLASIILCSIYLATLIISFVSININKHQ